MGEEISDLSKLIELEKEGKLGVLCRHFIYFSEKSSLDSLRVFSTQEVLNKIKKKNLLIYFNGNGQEGYNLFVGVENTKNFTVSDFTAHRMSWEGIETKLREEVEMFRELGFRIKYKGHLSDKYV